MDEIKKELRKKLLIILHQCLSDMNYACLSYSGKLSDLQLITISDDVIQEVAKISSDARKEELNELEKFETK